MCSPMENTKKKRKTKGIKTVFYTTVEYIRDILENMKKNSVA